MVRRDQQIDASNFVYSIGRKNSALFENYRFKKGTTWFRICQSLKKGVRIPPVKLYAPYLEAKIDYANGEYNKYQNSMQMFNSFWGEFMRWFARVYRPADTHLEVYIDGN